MSDGYQSDSGASLAQSGQGTVYFTGIRAVGNGEVHISSTSSDGLVIESILTTSNSLIIEVTASSGSANLKPEITFKGQSVVLEQDSNYNVWRGEVSVVIVGSELLTVVHVDGHSDTLELIFTNGPQVLSAGFIDEYPNGQTHLKQGDKMRFSVTSSTPFSAIEFWNVEALKYQVFEFGSLENSAEVEVEIADRGITDKSLGAVMRLRDEFGMYGTPFDTTTHSNVGLISQVLLNNQFPTIEVIEVEYPAGQRALKGIESALVYHTINDFDSVVYSSPGQELIIPSAFNFSSELTVIRSSGDYNTSEVNLRITAKRISNGAEKSSDVVVQIANQPPQITVQTVDERLVSSFNSISEHTINLLCDQLLLDVPTIESPVGNLIGAMEQLGDTGYFQELAINESDQKGAHNFTLIHAIGLSGIGGELVNSGFDIGGFTRRKFYIPRFTDTVYLGTHVDDVSKLIVLDKDNLEQAFIETNTQERHAYTLVDAFGNIDPNGDHIKLLDYLAVANNTSSMASITVEEIQ